MGRGAGGGKRGAGRASALSAEERRLFGSVPKDHLALVSAVTVEDAVISHGHQVDGYYSEASREIFLDRNAPRGSARHELGHAVWFERLTFDQRYRFAQGFYRDERRLDAEGKWNWDGRGRYWLSDYAGSNPMEAFADAYGFSTGSRSERARVSRADPVFREVLQEVGAWRE